MLLNQESARWSRTSADSHLRCANRRLVDELNHALRECTSARRDWIRQIQNRHIHGCREDGREREGPRGREGGEEGGDGGKSSGREAGEAAAAEVGAAEEEAAAGGGGGDGVLRAGTGG
jgi:hypothetical protein